MLRSALLAFAVCLLFLGFIGSIPEVAWADRKPIQELRRPEHQGEPEVPSGTLPNRIDLLSSGTSLQVSTSGSTSTEAFKCDCSVVLRQIVAFWIRYRVSS